MDDNFLIVLHPAGRFEDSPLIKGTTVWILFMTFIGSGQEVRLLSRCGGQPLAMPGTPLFGRPIERPILISTGNGLRSNDTSPAKNGSSTSVKNELGTSKTSVLTAT